MSFWAFDISFNWAWSITGLYTVVWRNSVGLCTWSNTVLWLANNTYGLKMVIGHMMKIAFLGQSQRRIWAWASNHAWTSQNDSVNYSGWPLK